MCAPRRSCPTAGSPRSWGGDRGRLQEGGARHRAGQAVRRGRGERPAVENRGSTFRARSTPRCWRSSSSVSPPRPNSRTRAKPSRSIWSRRRNSTRSCRASATPSRSRSLPPSRRRGQAAIEPPPVPTPPAPPPELKTADEPTPSSAAQARAAAAGGQTAAEDAPTPPVKPKEPPPGQVQARRGRQATGEGQARRTGQAAEDLRSQRHRQTDRASQVHARSDADRRAGAAGTARPARGAHVAIAVGRARRVAPGGLFELLDAAADHAGGRALHRRGAGRVQRRRRARPPAELLNPPSDPAWRAHAESAMRAALKCNPLRVPPQYAPYFEQWKTKTVHFDPQSASAERGARNAERKSETLPS